MDLTPEISDRLELAAARLKAATNPDGPLEPPDGTPAAAGLPGAAEPESPLEPPPGTPAAARLAPDPAGAPLTEARRDLRRARTRLEELEGALAELWADPGEGLAPAA